MTLDQMRTALDRTRLPSGGCLLSLATASDFYEADHDLVMAAVDEIEMKTPLVSAGVGTFTACERLLFQLLRWAAMTTPPVPQQHRH